MGSKRVIRVDEVKGLVVLENFIKRTGATGLINGWATYADAAGTSPVDGTGGTPVSTFAVSTDSSLVGASNFLWSKTAVNRQGEGFSYAFTIDSGYQSRPMTISALYKIASGTYADNDMTVWVYDVTNAVLIQPSAYQILNTTGVAQIKCEFQANSNSTSYRLIFHTASTSALAYTIRFDSFSVSPNTYNSGAGITDWVAYTPTLTGFGTATNVSFFSRRVGGDLEVRGRFTSGTSTAVAAQITLPTGLTIDSTQAPTIRVFGNAATTESVARYFVAVGTGGNTYFGIGVHQAGSAGIATPVVNTWISSPDSLSVTASIPILGWGTSQVLSSETSTSVVTAIVNGTPQAAYTINTPIVFPTASRDTHGGYNTTTGQYTAPVSGYYEVKVFIYPSAGGTGNRSLSAYVAAVQQPNWIAFNSSSTTAQFGSTTVFANAGQTIDVRGDDAWTAVVAGTRNGMTITRVSGPAQIAASEKITAVYSLSANSAPGAGNPLNFNTKVTDSHGTVTTGASWKFTAPSARNYMVSTSAAFVSTAGYLSIYKNGAAYQDIAYLGTGAGQSFLSTNTVTVPMAAGDYIDFRASAATSFAGVGGGATATAITTVSITSQG